MSKIPDEPFDKDALTVAAEGLQIAAERAEQNPEQPRFLPLLHPLARYQGELWFVLDTHLNISVFHWTGRTAQTKANVVAQALNVLGHVNE